MVVRINDLIINGIKAKNDVLGVDFFTFADLSNYVESVINSSDLELTLDFDDVDYFPEIIETEIGYEIGDIKSFYKSYMEDSDNKKKSSLLLEPELLNKSVFADSGFMVCNNNGRLQVVCDNNVESLLGKTNLTADKVKQLINTYLSDIYSLYKEEKSNSKVYIGNASFRKMPADHYFLIKRDRLVSDCYLLFRVMDSYESEDELIPYIKAEVQGTIRKELEERYDSYDYLFSNKNVIPFNNNDLLGDNLLTLDSFVDREKVTSNILNCNRSKHEKKI